MKAVQNAALVFIIGAVFLFFFTNGLQAFTSEGVRRLNVENNPVAVPNIELISASGDPLLIKDFAGKIVLVDFIFTSCTNVCPMVTKSFQLLHKELERFHMDENVVLLTVSFDPDRDIPTVLENYASVVGADSHLWKITTVNEKRQLQKLLDAFGIVVIPTPDGQYEHNSAIHLVNQSGMLAKIYDYESTELILQDIKELYHVL